MKKKATARPAKATSRQSTLNFPTSSEADLVAESAAAVTSTKSGAKSRRKRTADFADDADKHNESPCDSSAISAQSAVKTTSRSKGQSINAKRPSWSNLPLSDLVHSIDQGWSPRCENYAASSHSEWAVIKTTAIQNLKFLDDENKSLPSTLEPRQHLELRPGDLLITRAGPRNRVGVACLVRSTRPRLMLCDKAYRLKCRLDVVEPAFLELALNSPDLVAQVNKLKTGISDSGVNITQTPFMNLEIPLPPLPEQHRIVAEIEKQFTRLDAGVAALKRVQANLKRYRAAVLKAACEGHLVPTEAELQKSEGREQKSKARYETGEALLARILTDRRQKWEGRGQYKEPDAPVTAHLPPVPAGWAVASLEQLTSPVRPICYGILMPKDNVATGVLFVKVKDMKGDTIDLGGLHRTTPEIAAKYARASLRTGDLLLSIRGTYGRVAEVPRELDGGNITQDTARLDVTGMVNHRYIATCLRNPDCQNHFKRVARGVAVKGVNIGDVRPTPVPLPPLAEQTRIVAEVERRLSVVDQLEAVVFANLKRATRLRQSILQKAFTGELTGAATCSDGLQVQRDGS